MTCFLWPFARSLRPPHPSILSYTLWIPFRLKGNSHKIWLVPALSVQEQASFPLPPVVAPLGKSEFGNIISSIKQVFGQHLETCMRRHMTVKIAINCSANFDATVIALFKIVSDNRINNSLRRSVGSVDTTGISHISVNLEVDRLFGCRDSTRESLFTFSLVFTFHKIHFYEFARTRACQKGLSWAQFENIKHLKWTPSDCTLFNDWIIDSLWRHGVKVEPFWCIAVL